MKRWLLAPILALVLGTSPSCVIVAGDGDAVLTVRNESSYAFYEIYVAPAGTGVFGRNLLGIDPLFPGESLDIFVRCGFYDVMVVDEDGFTCTLTGEYLCYENRYWILDDLDLVICPF